MGLSNENANTKEKKKFLESLFCQKAHLSLSETLISFPGVNDLPQQVLGLLKSPTSLSCMLLNVMN